MNRIAAALAVAILHADAPAAAEIETVAVETKTGKLERWWPKVAPPKGWHHDRPNSLNYNLNAMAPEGDSFSNAEVVLYARAVKKASDTSLHSLADFIARERNSFLKRTPGYTVREEKALVTKEGAGMPVRSFVPKTDGNWERVAYLEDNDHWLVFVASARSKKALDGVLRNFQAMAWQYRRGP